MTTIISTKKAPQMGTNICGDNQEACVGVVMYGHHPNDVIIPQHLINQ